MPLRKRAQKRTQKRTQKRSSKRLKPQKSLIKRLKGGEGDDDELGDEWDKLDKCNSKITEKERLECKIRKTNNEKLRNELTLQLQKLTDNIKKKKEEDLNEIYKTIALGLCNCDNDANKNDKLTIIMNRLKTVETYCKEEDSRTYCGNLRRDGTPEPQNVKQMYLKFFR